MNLRPAYTFQDVTLVPKASNVESRKDISLKTNVTKHITLNNPLVASCMDTVSSPQMAIEMARHGGLALLPRFCSIEEQVKNVKQVKRDQGFIIEKPYTISEYETVADLKDLMDEYNVGSFLVETSPNLLRGIITNRDIRFQEDTTLIKDLMTPVGEYYYTIDDMANNGCVITAPENITMDEAKEIMKKYRIKKLPIVSHYIYSENNSPPQYTCNTTSSSRSIYNVIKGLICAKDIKKAIDCPFASLDDKGRLLVGAAIGINGDYFERATALVDAGVDILVIDTANGHNTNVVDATKFIVQSFPDIDVISGNVSTKEGFQALVDAGAAGIRVGIGSGSICTTRIVSGFGVPLLTSLLECKKLSKTTGVPMLSDGGTSGISGNMVKALAAGASAIILGSTLAGTDESPGEKVTKDGKAMKHYRGMAGYISNSTKRRKLSKDGTYTMQGFIPEGVEGFVECKGPVSGVIEQLIGGIKSGISYIGNSISDLQTKAQFRIVTVAGKREGESRVAK